MRSPASTARLNSVLVLKLRLAYIVRHRSLSVVADTLEAGDLVNKRNLGTGRGDRTLGGTPARPGTTSTRAGYVTAQAFTVPDHAGAT